MSAEPSRLDWLTPRQCANRLHIPGTAFILGEIREGRLPALVLERPGHRALYLVNPKALEAYRKRYRWIQPIIPEQV